MTIEIPSAEEARAQSFGPLVEKLTQSIAEHISIAVKAGQNRASIVNPSYPQMRAAPIVAATLKEKGYTVTYGSDCRESWVTVEW